MKALPDKSIARSTAEYGPIKRLIIKLGIIGDEDELILMDKRFGSKNKIFTYEWIKHLRPEKLMYIRTEVETQSYLGKRVALSNPIWLQSPEEMAAEMEEKNAQPII